MQRSLDGRWHSVEPIGLLGLAQQHDTARMVVGSIYHEFRHMQYHIWAVRYCMSTMGQSCDACARQTIAGAVGQGKVCRAIDRWSEFDQCIM